MNNLILKRSGRGFRVEFAKERKSCELCGRRLALPERDPTKIAICKKCLHGELH